jgi:hypothetical protein
MWAERRSGDDNCSAVKRDRDEDDNIQLHQGRATPSRSYVTPNKLRHKHQTAGRHERIDRPQDRLRAAKAPKLSESGSRRQRERNELCEPVGDAVVRDERNP